MQNLLTPKLTQNQLRDHEALSGILKNIYSFLIEEYGLRRLFSIAVMATKDKPINESNDEIFKLCGFIFSASQPVILNQLTSNILVHRKSIILPFAAVYEEVIKYLVVINKDGTYERDAEGKIYVSEDLQNWENFFNSVNTLGVVDLNLFKNAFETIKKECPKLLKEIKNLIGILCDVEWNYST